LAVIINEILHDYKALSQLRYHIILYNRPDQ
jgi:hypothetical protein